MNERFKLRQPRPEGLSGAAKKALREALVAAGALIAAVPAPADAQITLSAIEVNISNETLSRDQSIVRLALELPNVGQKETVNKGRSYEADMRDIGVPREIDWRVFYPLARETEEDFWKDLAREKSPHYPVNKEVHLPDGVITSLRSFSQVHGERNPLELGQAVFLVYKDIAKRKAVPTPKEIHETAARMKHIRDMYAHIDYLGPERDVIVAGGADVWREETKIAGFKFINETLMEALLSRQKKTDDSFFRGPTMHDEVRETKRRLLYTLAAAKKPLTFFFEGHGEYKSESENGHVLSSLLKITAQDLIFSMEARYAHLPNRERAFKNPDIFFFSECYGYDIAEHINRHLQSKGLPTLIIGTLAERSSIGFSEPENKYAGAYNEMVATSKHLGELLSRSSSPLLVTKPTMMAPDNHKSGSKAGARSRFMQISGAPPPSMVSVA